MTTDPEPVSRVDEQLSAWLDDELADGELELLSRRLIQGGELRARVARYALIGSCLREGRSAGLAGNIAALRLSDRVRAAVDGPAEAAVEDPGRRTRRWSPYAIAASVALLSVALVPVLRKVDNPQPAGRQAAESVVFVDAAAPALVSPDRMTNYLVYHGEFSGVLSAKVTDSNIINHRAFIVAPSMAGGSSSR
jgi:negative regulator of sigma E activity